MPTVIIRFNPDSYIKGDEKITSYTGRHKELMGAVNSIMGLESVDDMLTVYYMFYDDYDVLTPMIIDMDEVHNFE